MMGEEMIDANQGDDADREGIVIDEETNTILSAIAEAPERDIDRMVEITGVTFEGFAAFARERGLENDPAANAIMDALRLRAGKRDLQPGDRMTDGTVYAGLSPDTGKAMYATPKDAPLTMKWKQAMEYAAALDAHDHHDWRVPTKGELNVLFQNRAAIGGFNETYSASGSDWYLSSSERERFYVAYQCFGDGFQWDFSKVYNSSLRCVR